MSKTISNPEVLAEACEKLKETNKDLELCNEQLGKDLERVGHRLFFVKLLAIVIGTRLIMRV